MDFLDKTKSRDLMSGFSISLLILSVAPPNLNINHSQDLLWLYTQHKIAITKGFNRTGHIIQETCFAMNMDVRGIIQTVTVVFVFADRGQPGG